MAASHHEPYQYAPGVKATDCAWGQFFEGRWPDLWAASLVRDHWKPEGWRKVRVEVTESGEVFHRQRNDAAISIERTSTHRYRVCRHWSDEERQRIERRTAIAEARAAAQSRLDALPASAGQARATMCDLVGDFVRLLDNTCVRGAFRLRNSDALALALRRVAAVVETGTIDFDVVTRELERAAILERYGLQDSDFPAPNRPVLRLVKTS